MTQKITLLVLFFASALFSQTRFQLEKLQDFAKVYGVVRYFHPSDEASAIDWKKFSVYAVKEILEVKSQAEFEIKLQELFFPVAPSLTLSGNKYNWDTNAKYPVYWVHNGLGIDSKSGNNYSSQRFNKGRNPSGLKSLAISNHLKINRSKGIKLTYEARTEAGSAYGYLNLLDDQNNDLAIVGHKQNPVLSDKWENRELVTTGINKLSRIIIGLFSEGGDSEFRNIKLFNKNMEGEWNEIQLPPLSNDEWFAEPKGNYIYKNNNQVLISQISKSEQLYNLDDNVLESKIYNVSLSNNLNIIVPNLVYADEQQTLPVANAAKFEKLQENIKTINKAEFDRSSAIANVIITWNIFKHFYPYSDEIKVDWNYILAVALKESFDNKDLNAQKLTLEKLTENFKDGHISIDNKTIDLKEDEIYTTPLKFRFVGNELVVQDIFDSTGGKIRKGDVVKEINRVPTAVFMDSITQYISGSKQLKRVKAIRRMNNGEEGTVLSITTAKVTNALIKRKVPYKSNADFFELERTEKFIKVNNDIFYINLNKLSGKDLDSLIPIINLHEALIIDLRGYPKDLGHRLISYTPVVDIAKWMCRQTFVAPDQSQVIENCKGYLLNVEKIFPVLKTKNVLLIDARSISNAEFLAQLIKEYKVATIVGQPSAGVNGNINRIELLNGFSVLYTGMKVKNPDRSQFNSIGVIPEILIDENVIDIKKGKDIFIEKAIEFINTIINN